MEPFELLTVIQHIYVGLNWAMRTASVYYLVGKDDHQTSKYGNEVDEKIHTVPETTKQLTNNRYLLLLPPHMKSKHLKDTRNAKSYDLSRMWA